MTDRHPTTQRRTGVALGVSHPPRRAAPGRRRRVANTINIIIDIIIASMSINIIIVITKIVNIITTISMVRMLAITRMMMTLMQI